MIDGVWILPNKTGKSGKVEPIDLVGRKGHNLLKLSKFDLKVPEGFILNSQELSSMQINEHIKEKIKLQLSELENITSCNFGAEKRAPLLLSVRSSPSQSLPGVLDSILNIGLNSKILNSLKDSSKYLMYLDNYRRFLKDFSVSVFKVNSSYFEMLEHDLLDELEFSSFDQCNE